MILNLTTANSPRSPLSCDWRGLARLEVEPGWSIRAGSSLQLPLHPQQVISWVFLLSFTIYIFLTLIPAIHSSAQLPLLMINLVVFGVHYVSHFTSLLIDPSDPALLALYSNKPVPQLDKSRFSHVIENGR